MPTRYDKEFKQNIINLYKQGEIKAMEKRLASLSEENEILKKALGFHIIKMIGTDFICLMKKLNTMWVATP